MVRPVRRPTTHSPGARASWPFISNLALSAVRRAPSIRALDATRNKPFMRHIGLLSGILFLWLNGTAVFCAQTNIQKQPIVLTVEITSQQYCAVTSDLSSLQMKLKLRYTNVGHQKLILYKGHDLFYQIKIRSLNTGMVKPYEVTFLNSRYFDEQPELIEQPSPSNVFVILAPGASYERELVSGIGVAAQETNRGNSVLVDGAYTLQLTVSTWYKSKSLAQKLRQRWERKGLLWFETITSAPIHFTVTRSNGVVSCR